MTLWDSIRMAFAALSANAWRSALTILGVVIGVAAVIALLAVGQGARQEVLGSIERLGTNLIFVLPDEVPGGSELTLADAQAIGRLPGVRDVAPQAGGPSTVSRGRESAFAYLFGTTPAYVPVRNAEVALGRFLNQGDLDASARVAVIGLQTADDLGSRDLLGQRITIRDVPFTVVGLLKPRGSTGFINQDQLVLVPVSTALTRLIGGDSLYAVSVQVEETVQMDRVEEGIVRLLRERHRTAAEEPDDFLLTKQTDILEAVGSITGVLTALLAGIAAISLLVGGIGIMNIMLVSVTERTREIGIRKAVGATRANILAQFLVESVVLSVFGGVVGMGLGWVLSRLAQPALGFATQVSLDYVLLAFGVSAFVGIFFGVYPAWKASRQDPIEALRYE